MANGSGFPIVRALRSFLSSFQRTSTQAQSATTQSNTNGAARATANNSQSGGAPLRERTISEPRNPHLNGTLISNENPITNRVTKFPLTLRNIGPINSNAGGTTNASSRKTSTGLNSLSAIPPNRFPLPSYSQHVANNSAIAPLAPSPRRGNNPIPPYMIPEVDYEEDSSSQQQTGRTPPPIPPRPKNQPQSVALPLTNYARQNLTAISQPTSEQLAFHQQHSQPSTLPATNQPIRKTRRQPPNVPPPPPPPPVSQRQHSIQGDVLPPLSASRDRSHRASLLTPEPSPLSAPSGRTHMSTVASMLPRLDEAQGASTGQRPEQERRQRIRRGRDNRHQTRPNINTRPPAGQDRSSFLQTVPHPSGALPRRYPLGSEQQAASNPFSLRADPQAASEQSSVAGIAAMNNDIANFSSSSQACVSNQQCVNSYEDLMQKEQSILIREKELATLSHNRIENPSSEIVDDIPKPLSSDELSGLLCTDALGSDSLVLARTTIAELNDRLESLYQVILTFEPEIQEKISDIPVSDRAKRLDEMYEDIENLLNSQLFETVKTELKVLNSFAKINSGRLIACKNWGRELETFLDKTFFVLKNKESKVHISNRDFLRSPAKYRDAISVQLDKHGADPEGNFTDGGVAKAAILQITYDTLVGLYSDLIGLNLNYISMLNQLARKQKVMSDINN